MTTVTKASTKLVLFAHIAALDAQLIAKGREAQLLRNELSMLRTQPALPLRAAGKPDHSAYYQYVNAQRRASYAAGKKVTSYLTFENWAASRGNAQRVAA